MGVREVSGAEFGLLNERALARLRVCVLVGITLAVGVFWAVGYLLIRYHQRQIRQLDARMAAYRREVERLPIYRRALRQALAIRDEARARWERARRRMPSTARRPELVAQLLKLAETEGVTLRTLQEETRPPGGPSNAVALTGEAVAPYERLAYWLWRIERFERYIRITQLRISADNENCRAIVHLVAPYGDLNGQRGTSHNDLLSAQAHQRVGSRR